jgi:hypothetical protein
MRKATVAAGTAEIEIHFEGPAGSKMLTATDKATAVQLAIDTLRQEGPKKFNMADVLLSLGRKGIQSYINIKGRVYKLTTVD